MFDKVKSKVSNIAHSDITRTVVTYAAIIGVLIVVTAVMNVGVRELDAAITGAIHPQPEQGN